MIPQTSVGVALGIEYSKICVIVLPWLQPQRQTFKNKYACTRSLWMQITANHEPQTVNRKPQAASRKPLAANHKFRMCRRVQINV